MPRNWLAEKAVLADLDISQWTARKYDKKESDEHNESKKADKNASRVNKLLVPKESIAPITNIAGKAVNLHHELTQPWCNSGARLLPAALYLDYTDKVAKIKTEFEDAVDKFVSNYPRHIEQGRDLLKGMFREQDYPEPHEIRSRFGFKVVILPCPDASDFRVDLAKEHAEDIKRDLEQRLKEALDEAMKEPARRIVETVGHMAERLRAYTGKRDGSFKDTLVGNVRELVEILPAFNLTNNQTIADLTARMRQELCEETPKVLRENDDVRQSVAASAEKILEDARAFIA